MEDHSMENFEKEKRTRKKVMVEFPAGDHADLKMFCILRETNISRVMRALWRRHKADWSEKKGWPPKPLDSMDDL